MQNSAAPPRVGRRLLDWPQPGSSWRRCPLLVACCLWLLAPDVKSSIAYLLDSTYSTYSLRRRLPLASHLSTLSSSSSRHPSRRFPSTRSSPAAATTIQRLLRSLGCRAHLSSPRFADSFAHHEGHFQGASPPAPSAVARLAPSAPSLVYLLQTSRSLVHLLTRSLGSQAAKVHARRRTLRAGMPTPRHPPPPPVRTPRTDDSLQQISAVKEKISAEKGWDPKLQKLIYSGISASAASCITLVQSAYCDIRQDLEG